MFATVECEVAVFGCRTIESDLSAVVPGVLARPGADHVLTSLPPPRWALLSPVPAGQLAEAFERISLPVPPTVVTVPSTAGAEPFGADDYRAAVARLDADPTVSLSFEDTAAGVAAAKAAGLQVIGVATFAEPAALAVADLVVPSLLSVRVLGTHPFIVFEVDAIPGTGSAAGAPD